MMAVGCDSSTQKIALTALDGDHAVIQDIRLGAPYSTDHPQRAYLAVCSFLTTLGDDLNSTTNKAGDDGGTDGGKHVRGRFFLEAPILARGNIQTALKLGMIAGAVLVAAQEWELKPVLVSPTAWKKGIGLPGSAGKRQVAAWLMDTSPSLAGLCAHDQDRIDSCCVALYGRGLGVRADDLLAAAGGVQGTGTPVLQSPRLRTRVRRPEGLRRPS